MADDRLFKECPGCGQRWLTRAEFLADDTVKVVGYQVNFEDLLLGLMLFNHDADGCGTTLSTDAGAFLDLHEGPVFTQRCTDSVECNGLCRDKYDLSPCPAQCECAYVRDVIQQIRGWPKVRPR